MLLLTACGPLRQLMPGAARSDEAGQLRISNATAAVVGDVICEEKQGDTEADAKAPAEYVYTQFVRVRVGATEIQGQRTCADGDDGITAGTQGTLILSRDGEQFIDFVPQRDL